MLGDEYLNKKLQVKSLKKQTNVRPVQLKYTEDTHYHEMSYVKMNGNKAQKWETLLMNNMF